MTNWNGRTVLVTGADGFIGSHLAEQLVRAGANVRAFVHYNPFGKWGWLDNNPLAASIDIVPGDIRDAERVSDAVQGCDTVFHLAALIGIPYSYVAPESYIQVNVTGTHNVARACLRNGNARMIHTSTSEVYGTARTVPISEDHPLQPQSPYSASKIGADAMAMSFHHSFELPLAIVRPFNTYGPRQSTRAVIPTILAQLQAKAPTLKLGALSPTRDFTYVSDTASGFMAVANADAALGNVVNLGVGEEISIGDLAALCMNIVGHQAELVTDEDRNRPKGSEVERLLSDNARARDWANWTPQVSLRDGLERTAEWVADHLAELDTKRYAI